MPAAAASTSQACAPGPRARNAASATVSVTILPHGLDLYVAPEGDDGAAGTESEPLASLEGARDRLRTLRADDEIPDEVELPLDLARFPT